MAETNSIHSLTNTLGSPSIPSQTPLDQQHLQHPPQHPPLIPNPGELPQHPGMSMPMPPPGNLQQQIDGVNSDQPVKRRPGRPKGSGKKPVDPNAPPKIKRPVGRPRKDGLPAGSVGPRRPGRPRKRPPGVHASGTQPPSGVFSFTAPFDGSWGSASAPPMGIRPGRPSVFPIDPSLDSEEWGEMVRNRPDRFLHALVSALDAPNPLSGSGPSVEEAFKSHLVSLAPNSKNAPIPSLYSILKTFWLPSSPVYFSLTASASTARTPSEHRFLYWDPQPLVFNGISCPVCSTPLTNRGRISSGPIKVHDLGKPFFVIGCEYVCTSPPCLTATGSQGRKFASTDASILRALPLKLKDEFPALLLQGNPDLGSGPEIWAWHGMGVSTSLWNMVRASLHAGLRKEAILDIVRAIQHGTADCNYSAYKLEEEDDDPDDEEEEEENHDEQQIEGELADKDKSAEEFQEAWNANSGVADSNGAPPPMQQEQAHAGPSTAPPPAVAPNGQESVSAAHQVQQHIPPPQFAYAGPQGPYPSYPAAFASYWNPQAQEQPQSQLPAKRPWSMVEDEPQHKRVRHCCKCGSNECKGKGGRAFCTNPCQDCGKQECKGRNSKRPDRTCADAWP